MEPFARLTSRAAPLPQANIDTDIILPARFLLNTEKRGLGRYAFYEWRKAGQFVLDLPLYAGAQILVAGDNFGCGSSREQAPWSILDLGIRCIVAPSFGEIFRGNCLCNGILPIVLPQSEWLLVLDAAEAGDTVTVDLSAQKILLHQGQVIEFAFDPAEKEALLLGCDEIDGIRSKYGMDIAKFEVRQRIVAPWLWDKELVDG